MKPSATDEETRALALYELAWLTPRPAFLPGPRKFLKYFSKGRALEGIAFVFTRDPARAATSALTRDRHHGRFDGRDQIREIRASRQASLAPAAGGSYAEGRTQFGGVGVQRIGRTGGQESERLRPPRPTGVFLIGRLPSANDRACVIGPSCGLRTFPRDWLDVFGKIMGSVA